MRKVICRLAVLIDQWNAQMSESGKPSMRLSQRRLADEIGVAATTLNRLYNNSFDRVDINTIERICNYFSCEVGDLLVMKDVEGDAE